jgi:hypothetical protein
LSVKDIFSRGEARCKHLYTNHFYYNHEWVQMLIPKFRRDGVYIYCNEFKKMSYKGVEERWYLTKVTYKVIQRVRKPVKVKVEVAHRLIKDTSRNSSGRIGTRFKRVPFEILSGDVIQTVQGIGEGKWRGRKVPIPLLRHASFTVIENGQLWFVDTVGRGRKTKGRYRTNRDKGPKVIHHIERYPYPDRTI